MKKKLSQAIAVATLVGAAASVNAMNINQDGLGDILLFPLYTTENGNSTLVSLTNTTDKIKAVKVRFLEGMNSKEVLDFNLYMSPYDQWSGVVTLNAKGEPTLMSGDTSCTVGKIKEGGEVFKNYEYGAGSKKDTEDAKYHTLERAKVGHLEVIEMGEVDEDFELITGVKAGEAIIHGLDRVPGNCDAVAEAFRTGNWKTTQTGGMEDVAGGLYGSAVVINVEQGWQASNDALAIDNSTADATRIRHFKPGYVDPSLAHTTDEIFFKNGVNAYADNYNGVDAELNAVSALLMKSSIYNDYVVGAGLNAQTDMVITFPTKREYVNGSGAPHAPFTNAWSEENANACEPVAISYWDNEEQSEVVYEGDFSPLPETEEIALCYETNTFSISGSDVLGGQFVNHGMNFNSNFQIGWVDFTFNGSGQALVVKNEEDDSDITLAGLPAIGYSVVVTQNGDVGGLLSNYAATFNHKAETSVYH